LESELATPYVTDRLGIVGNVDRLGILENVETMRDTYHHVLRFAPLKSQ
jgi:hypothetical protein